MNTAAPLTDRELAELVDEGGKLARDIEPMERKKRRLDSIKEIMRERADGKTLTFTGKIYSATVEQKPDTIARVVAKDDVAYAIKTAGEHLPALFTLHPSKGQETNFELNALKCLAKRAAVALVARFTRPAVAWVRFR